ncbi:cytosolic phospholipase A2 gamma-like protein [Labeo rohita]|uniref:Cytosolic phospholipase A2 gamma-like protein n=1 Tax=Labeo rohita TaxID=84645 RepID=A0A498NA47_LABRO|nr:cytosolic phospholipase A2 gamma-like protein [Labeo rohita]
MSQEYGEVRIKHSLNKKEEEFVVKRREAVFQSLQKLKIHCSQDEVPRIALLGSGGGQRAMVGLLGSLVQLDKAGLLDCILYLSGVSGSTWCMASLYQEPDWSTNLKIVKDKIIKRLSGPRVSLTDALAKLKKYYYENDIFSLTDIWAVMAITEYVKEIDEHTLTDQQDQHNKDPLLIYTVIDVQSKQCRDGDAWFEISPYEAGYSLTGAFVKASSFGSQFDNGCKIKDQPEMDMLYLQDSNCPPVDKCSQVLMDLADMNLSVLNGTDPRALDESIRTTLKDKTVPAALLESETRDYIDAGLLLNSPYFSVLREERNIDLIISLDFSEGDPFATMRETADMCKEQNIPFPEVNIPNVEMSASKPQQSGEVRIKHSLNKNEEEFVARRRNTVLQCLQKFNIHCSQDKVPNIALLGSGGGQRAMVGLLGSLVELDKAGLLDCVLYLSGVSGSTWCMASLYKEPDWSTKLETVKDKIIKRLSGEGVNWKDALAKLRKYYYGKDFFSLTDVWAAMFVTSYVKEIDERTLTDEWKEHSKDPFPIYTVIDKHCKQSEEGDPWFEINPYEAGYSLTGAFVDASNFGSQFHEGSKKTHQNVFDMLYLQAVCSSALADGEEIWKWIKGLLPKIKASHEMEGGPNPQSIEECYQVLMDLVDMNLAVLEGTDISALDQSIKTTLNDISGGEGQLLCQAFSLGAGADLKADKQYMTQYTMDVCNHFVKLKLNFWPFDLLTSIYGCMSKWTWGRNYNFLHKMADEAVPTVLLQNETREFIDAGLLNNSPYFSVLREKRGVDLIISLDFSEGDPFMTVKETAKTCKKLNIPFPEVKIPSEDLEKPKDFYVFKGQNAPTVIHIPLFNVANCGGKLTTSYTFLFHSSLLFLTDEIIGHYHAIQFLQDAVPNIALLGSGGGQRAMVGLLGSLVELDKAGLLDCVLYLSGVSGSTWCMASLYKEPDWSTKLETVKDKIIKRLSGERVSWTDTLAKLKKYYYGKDFFSLTDVWAVAFVTSFVKEIDEHTLTDHWKEHSNDPFPIYTVIDKHCKQREEGDPWFEISPHEAGYSLTGAFVDASNFGSQFHEGSKKNHQDEFDMLYLQAVCGSAFADEVEIWKWIKDPNSPSTDKCYQVLMNLVDMNIAVLEGTNLSALDQSIKTKLNDISGGQGLVFFKLCSLDVNVDIKAEKKFITQYTLDVCNYFSDNLKLRSWPFDLLISIFKCMAKWTWGRNYNFLHNMSDEAVPTALLQNETRDYIDAGLLNNSPYFSVLREKRGIDLIISLDFSEGDPFLTVKETAKTCKKLNIPFPEVNIPSEDLAKPKDFYVFKGQNAPTVIHIPLFNVVNCGGKLTSFSHPEQKAEISIVF